MACLEQDCWIRLNTNAPWNDSGEGLFSTREIEMGHLIYTEFPETIVNHLDPKYRDNTGDGIDLLYFCRSSLTREKYDEELKYTLLGKNTADMLVKKRKGGIFDWTTELEMLSVKPTWVNHSCVPNMYRIDSNDLITGRLKCQFFALRDISEGEELTIAYEDVVEWESVSTRRAFLGREYGFFCRCLRCAEESELRDMEPLRPAHMNLSLQIRNDSRKMDGAGDHDTSRSVKTQDYKLPKTYSEDYLHLRHSKALSSSRGRTRLRLKSLLVGLRDRFNKSDIAENTLAMDSHDSLERLDEEDETHAAVAQSGLPLSIREQKRKENSTI
ncbi:uncharacterized protein H6S33_008507 [Morchella sextelata]|uniref:uncharacterized protein n=1 Tax=Morchella sextelata TaxID=1174677 RepID=UPI001D04B678|nr:uncharacterized protein H6S33_008507 [Morchella sextelata]KAH0602857.1 hypothetical protein H6S33_008507 [Morchella sextelata]